MASYADPCVCLLAKSTGKPDAGNPHVRFDEGEGSALPTLPVKKYSVVSYAEKEGATGTKSVNRQG